MAASLKTVALLPKLRCQLQKVSFNGSRHFHHMYMGACSPANAPVSPVVYNVSSERLANPVTSITHTSEATLRTKVTPTFLHTKWDVQGSLGRHSEVDLFHSSLEVIGRLNSMSINKGPIGDKINTKLKYELPKTPGHSIEKTTPPANSKQPILVPQASHSIIKDAPGTGGPVKMARMIIAIRRLKIKKHKLRKVRKRLWPIRRKEKFMRNMKAKRVFKERLDTIRSYGTKFNAEELVEYNLESGKQGGYQINTLGPESQTFGFIEKGIKEPDTTVAKNVKKQRYYKKQTESI